MKYNKLSGHDLIILFAMTVSWKFWDHWYQATYFIYSIHVNVNAILYDYEAKGDN